MIPWHVAAARLGEGDLHPGGADATRRLLEWMAGLPAGDVLEIGPGLGLSALRVQAAGRRVEAIEAHPEMARLYHQRTGLSVVHAPAEALVTWPEARYAAVLAESVLYGTDLPVALAGIARVLRPGGGLLLSDATWCEGTSPEVARQANLDSRRRFGIPMASEQPWTWADWRQMLGAAGLRLVHEERLGPGSPGGPTRERGPATAWLRDPAAGLAMLRLRWRRRWGRTQGGQVESWVGLAVRG